MSEPLTILAHVRAKAGKESRLREELQRLIAPSRAEAGCVDYVLHQSLKDPTLFMFYENWKSKADLEAHRRTPHLQALGKVAPELLEGPTEITEWKIVKW